MSPAVIVCAFVAVTAAFGDEALGSMNARNLPLSSPLELIIPKLNIRAATFGFFAMFPVRLVFTEATGPTTWLDGPRETGPLNVSRRAKGAVATRVAAATAFILLRRPLLFLRGNKRVSERGYFFGGDQGDSSSSSDFAARIERSRPTLPVNGGMDEIRGRSSRPPVVTASRTAPSCGDLDATMIQSALAKRVDVIGPTSPNQLH